MQKSQYFRIFIRERWKIYYFTAGLSIIVLIYSSIIPKIYQSIGQVLAQEETGGMLGISSLIAEATKGTGGRIANVAKAAGLSLGHTPADVLKAFLTSRSVLEKVITDLDLFKIFKIRNNSMETALKMLGPLLTTEVSKEEIVVIRVKYKNPKLAADIVNSLINNLDLLLKERSMTKAKYERVFLEGRLSDASRELAVSEESLKVYQERHRTVSPAEEIKAAISAYAELKAKLFGKELEAEVLSRYSSEGSPYYASAKRDAQEFRKKLTEIESSDKTGQGFGVGFGISFKNLPKVEMEYFRRFRDVRVKEEIYAFLLQQHEQAKIMEVRNTPTITVLDWGKIPEKKIAPRRLKMFFIGSIIGFVLGLLSIIGTELWREAKKDERKSRPINDIRYALHTDIESIKKLLRVILKGRKGAKP